MVFVIPTGEFLKMAAAKKLAVKMGGIVFELSDEALDSLRVFAEELKF